MERKMAEPHPTRKHDMAEAERPSESSQWSDCPAGSLKQFASLESSRLLRRRLVNVGVVAGLSCVLLGLPILFSSNKTAPVNSPHGPYGGLSCREVVDRIDAFFASTVELSFRQRILQHLQACPSCMRRYERTAAELNVEIAALPANTRMHTFLPTSGCQPAACHDPAVSQLEGEQLAFSGQPLEFGR